MVVNLPYTFWFARMLVSGSLSVAAQASPDLLYGPHREQQKAVQLSARIDSLSTLSQFLLRPL